MAHLCPNCDEPCQCSGDDSPILTPRVVDCEHCDPLDDLVDENPEAFEDIEDEEVCEA